jgi:surface polysaccharide O-acyltransferase-like enzyme
VPPSRPLNLWSMSQRSGSVSYQTFASGFALALYALFALACDRGRLRLGVCATLGSNALAAYIIHDLVDGAIKPYAPQDAPLWFVLIAFALFFAICYLFVRHLEKNQLFLRL